MTIQMRAIEQYFHVLLFIVCCTTFKSVDGTLVGNHSVESYWPVHPCGTVYYAVQLLSLWMKPYCITIELKATG